MNVVYQNSISNLPACVATVGIFDGVHAGHRYLIDQVKKHALQKNVESVVITFAKHPRSVLNESFKPELLNTLDEKIALLSTTGIDTCIVLEFNKEISNLTAQEFLQSILKKKYNVQSLFVGHDHRFGHNRTDGFPEYMKYGAEIGIEVIEAKRFSTSEFEYISSSKIREHIHNGDLISANKLLNYNYSIKGTVVNGFKLGRKIGFPTANIMPDNFSKIIPPQGVYGVRIIIDDSKFNGMMNIGTRPTIDTSLKTSLEVNIFDFDQDIYSKTVEVEFIQKIRSEKKFNGIDQLIVQLVKDKTMVQEILSHS